MRSRLRGSGLVRGAPPPCPTRHPIRRRRTGCFIAPIRRWWLFWWRLALGTTVGWWVAHGGWSGRLIEVERAEPQNARFQVDVNRADWPELANLPGVGSVLAHRIVDCRRIGGPFADHEDLRRRVPGLGPRTLESHPTVSATRCPPEGPWWGNDAAGRHWAEDGARGDYFGRLFRI